MVLFVCYSGVYGGAERQLVETTAALELQACVACPEGALAIAARAAGIRVFPLPARTLHVRRTPRDRLLAVPRLVAHAFELRALVRNLDPELVVTWGMRSGLATLGGSGWRRRHLAPEPSASSAGASHRKVVFQHNELLPGPLIGRLVRAAAARADLVVAVSEAVARDVDPRARLGRRLIVVHPGVDVLSFDGGPLPAGPPEVLVLGAIVDCKRPELALEAFALVRERRPDARLRIVGAPLGGEHSLQERLQERAGRPDLVGAVELGGALADPREALRSATCLLHCAEREGFGLAVVEALAAGRPAVVPTTGGPAEIVDRSTGLVYTPGEPGAAAAAVLELLADPERAASMGAAGRIRARRLFDRAVAQRSYAAALATLVPRRDDEAPDTSGLAIVTVTHNSAPELEALLNSIERHLPGTRVVVADNASSDDSVGLARSWSGGALVLPLEQNLGFGSACNRALSEVRAPVAVLLNPDVELLDGSLVELAREVSRPEQPERVLAPLVLHPDGSRQDSVHPTPASLADLIRALVPLAAVPGRAALALAPWRAHHPRRVGWAVGCALVARTQTLLALGPFDERIFLYGEDLDLGLRAAAAGVQTWFWPAGRVMHRGAHTTHATFGGEPFERLASARHDVVARSLGAGRAQLDDLGQTVTFGSRAILKRLTRRSAERERRQRTALAAARARPR